MNAEDLAQSTTMSKQQAKDYLAILEAIKKAGNYDEDNLTIMHQAIMAEAQEKAIDPTRLAVAVLGDFK